MATATRAKAAARTLPVLSDLRRLSGRITVPGGGWRRYTTPASIAAILVGFGVVVQSWWDSGGTPDIRVQIEDVISALGAVALIISGVVVLAGDVLAGWRRETRSQLEALNATLRRLESVQSALATTLSGGAQAPTAQAPTADVPEASRPTASADPMVFATHASYHHAWCDLLEGRDSLRRMTVTAAVEAGLAPCRTCQGASAGISAAAPES